MLVPTMIIAALFGLAFGSFLNAAVFRLAKKESLLGRSHCQKCTYVLQWYDLIPVGSYLVLKGKCRSCDQKISPQYFLVELVMATLFAIVAGMWVQSAGAVPELYRDLFIVTVLVFLFVYDARYYLLPDIVTIPATIIVFVWQLILGQSLSSLLLAAGIGAGFFLLQFVVSKGKWIGGGDIRLGALMGVILGWPLILVGLFLAYIFGSIVAIPLLISKRKKMNSQIPFGIFLTLSTVVTMWWGSDLLDWYLSFL